MNYAGAKKIEECLSMGDPYSFAILVIDNLELLGEKYNQQAQTDAVENFEKLAKEHFSSGTLLTWHAEGKLIAFAPFKLDRNYMMDVFEAVQQGYGDWVQRNYPQSKSSVSISCVSGTKKTDPEELYQTATKLLSAIKVYGQHGYKIMEKE